MDKTSLSNRMKGYENISRSYLTPRVPVIIRIDGRTFHGVTKKLFGKAWNQEFTQIMSEVALHVLDNMQGCKFCYCQSDEISFLLTDYKTIRTGRWFDYNLNKMTSVSASIASSSFTSLTKTLVSFDSRAFSIPQDEVCNYFIERQQDALRNAIQMAGQEIVSHIELQNKSCDDIQEMLFIEKDINFNNYPVHRKRGFCFDNNDIDNSIPVFTKEREYVEKHVYMRED